MDTECYQESYDVEKVKLANVMDDVMDWFHIGTIGNMTTTTSTRELEKEVQQGEWNGTVLGSNKSNQQTITVIDWSIREHTYVLPPLMKRWDDRGKDFAVQNKFKKMDELSDKEMQIIKWKAAFLWLGKNKSRYQCTMHTANNDMKNRSQALGWLRSNYTTDDGNVND
jgi:hypothetical protein